MIDWSLLPVAFAGGALGAAIGGSAAFAFTGIFVLIGVAIAAGGGGKDFIANVAFGPLLGPHITFAGGVAAAAFAAKAGHHPTGRDLSRGLAGAARVDVLVAGGVFGVIGYLIQVGVAATAVGPLTDSVAASVFFSAVLARLVFGKTGLFGNRKQPGEWVGFQSAWQQVVSLGLLLGLASAYLTRIVGVDKGGDVLGFGVAATGLLFLHTGTTVPVWHHIALPAAIATTMTGGNLYAGAVAGLGGAILGELSARVFLNHGDTHIDPPAVAIAVMTLVLKLLL